MAATAISNAITLSGSTETVAEFLDFSVNYILHQRGVYPDDLFSRVTKYEMPMVMTQDQELKDYINNIVRQLKGKNKFSTSI